MSTLMRRAAALIVGAGALAFCGAASARIICNQDGDCWHSHDNWTIAPGLRLVVHPDDWRWREHDRYHWREHAGPGYWERNTWHDVH